MSESIKFSEKYLTIWSVGQWQSNVQTAVIERDQLMGYQSDGNDTLTLLLRGGNEVRIDCTKADDLLGMIISELGIE